MEGERKASQKRGLCFLNELVEPVLDSLTPSVAAKTAALLR